MRVTIIAFIALLQSWSSFSAEVVKVLNQEIINKGITGPSLIDWFTNKSTTVKQSKTGEFFYPLPDVYYNKDCTKIEEAKESAGTFTDKLFFLFVNKACVNEGAGYRLVMIIKEVKQGAVEINNLARILDKLDMFKIDNPNAAVLSPALNFFQYTGPGGQEKYFALIKAARGEPLLKLLQNEPVDNIRGIFFAVGKALGFFHLKFMDWATEAVAGSVGNFKDFYKTIVHGDAHLNNIFYDKEKGTTSLIDIETMAYSLDKKYSISVDLERLYNLPIYIWGQYNGCSANKTRDDCSKIIAAYRALFRGYIDAFPVDKQAQLKIYIKMFLEHHHKITFIPFDEQNVSSRIKDIEAESSDLKSAKDLHKSLDF